MVVVRIHRAYQHLQRYRQILAVLVRHGLAEGLDRLGLEFAQDLFARGAGQELRHQSHEERVRSALAELGPTFIKLGQILSVRPDLVGVSLASELKKLQTRVPSDGFAYVRALVEKELASPLETLYASFEPEPIASASIGQTHKAALHDGRRVVVKVQHEGIGPKVQVDLEILLDLADLLERNVEESRYVRPREVVEQFRQALLRELDFRHEARNLEQFGNLLSEEPGILIPLPILSHTSGAVLTMEYVEGVHASELEAIRALGVDPADVAVRGGDLFLKMVFVHGRFHADPHPGNILVLPGGVVALLDFGTVGRLSDEMREDLEDLIIALVRQQGDAACDIVVRLGSPPPDLDIGMLRAELVDLSGYYTKLSLADLNVGQLLSDVTELIRRHHIVLPAAVSMLIKVLITLEGTGRALSPEFNLAKLLEPYQAQVLLRRLSPQRQLKRVERLYRDFERAAQVVPMGVVDIVGQLKRGDLSVQLEHRGLDDLRCELRRSANCLALGLLTSALFLGSSLLLAATAPPLWLGQSLLGLLGLAGAFGLGLRLLWAVRRLGWVEPKRR
jgi:ubiquinone biosynthesis protein